MGCRVSFNVRVRRVIHGSSCMRDGLHCKGGEQLWTTKLLNAAQYVFKLQSPRTYVASHIHSMSLLRGFRLARGGIVDIVQVHHLRRRTIQHEHRSH